MAIDWTAYKATVKQGHIDARSATTIEAALEIQATAYQTALQLVISQASVDGGTCVDGGPVTGAQIT